MFLNLFLFYQVVWPLGHKTVNKYLYLYYFHKAHKPNPLFSPHPDTNETIVACTVTLGVFSRTPNTLKEYLVRAYFPIHNSHMLATRYKIFIAMQPFKVEMIHKTIVNIKYNITKYQTTQIILLSKSLRTFF